MLRIIKREARFKRPHMIWFHLHGMSKTEKSTGTESTLVIAREWGGMTVVTVNG